MQSETEKHQRLIQLLVRLMGVFFVVEGLTGVLGNGIDLIDQWKTARELEMRFQGSYALGWTVASVFLLTAGLCLIFKNQIAIDAIFHQQDNHSDRD